MSTRERVLATGVIVTILLAGGTFLFHQFVYVPIQERDRSIQDTRQDVEAKQEQLDQAIADQPRLARLRQLSLPADIDLSRREYEKYLGDLMRRSGFEAGSFSVTPKPPDSRSSPMLTGKKPAYTRLTFTVLAHANLESLVKMLEGFYRTGLLHQIKNLSIQRPVTAGPQQKPNDLDITLTAEALVINGAENRPRLLTKLDRQILARPPRNYTAIAGKNIFVGTTKKESEGDEVEVTRYVYLTDISHNGRYVQAFLYDRYNNRKTRLRSTPGFDQFRITDGEGETLVQGKVIHIGPRDLVFRADEKSYAVHIGQSLEDALQKPLTKDQVNVLTTETIGPQTQQKPS